MRSISGGVIWVLLAPLLYAGMSISAKLSGAYLSVWQIGVGRFENMLVQNDAVWGQ